MYKSDMFGLKIGHMPLALGEKQFFDNTKFGDDAIVLFADPTKQIHAALLTFKAVEGAKAANGDDTDGYVGLVTYNVDGNNTVGLNLTYLNNSNDRLKLSNIGLHANGKFAGFGYKGEADMQFGSIGDPKEKFRGYALMLAANYNINPVNIRGSLGYGSGDSNADDDKNKEFVNFLDAVQHYTLVYDYRVATTAGATATGLANTTYFNIGADYAPMKNVMASLDGYILRATKTAEGISKNAGWEVDAKVVYNVAKNLTYQVDAGYFNAGKFYEDSGLVAEKKGATVLRHMLTLNF
jgi:hypothetical protein